MSTPLADLGPIGPVNTPKTLAGDPQFIDRLPWRPAGQLIAEQLPFPARVAGAPPPAATTPAPELAQHREAILRDVLGRGSTSTPVQEA